MSQMKNFTKGFIKENPVFVLLLGLCPTLGVTTSAINGLGMGLATTFVLLSSNVVVSLIKNAIPDKVRIPAFIVIIASFVTIVELLMQAYLPALFDQLGLFIPLIVVNCLVLGSGAIFNIKFMEADGMLVFVLAPGAFIALGYLIAIINRINKKA